MFAIISGGLPCDFMINSTMNAIAIRTPTPCVTELKISSPIVYLFLVCCIDSSLICINAIVIFKCGYFMSVWLVGDVMIEMVNVCDLRYN